MNKRPGTIPASAKAVVESQIGDTPGGPGPVAGLPNAPINILIVDDEPKNLMVLETVLDDPSYRLVRAGSADQALLALVADEFAVLILDIRMPGMTGFELAEMIKERKKTAQVPIIFLTAYYNEDQHVLEGYGTGAVDYLHKPVNPVVLRSKVAIFADLHRKSRELGIANRALLSEVTERRQAQAQLRELNETLERRVTERTQALMERKKIEEVAREQLRASEQFNQSLMDSTVDCIQVLDLDGGLLHMNSRGMAQMEIGDFAAHSGRPWWSLWPDAERETLRSAVTQACAAGTASFTVLRPMADGTPKWWNVSVSPIRDALSGQVVRLLAVSRDVTEARQTEEILREAGEKKDKFIATLAHELRNPLAPIRNAVNLLRRRELADPQVAWCRDVIDRQVAQMTHLLEDLLDVSRITRTKLMLRREPLELAKVIEQAIETAQPFVDEAGQALTVTLPPAPVVLNGDLTRLAQVISNLLINAAKYTAAGGNIGLTAQREAGAVLIKVKDNGIGIAAEHLPHVFEMFGQVRSALEHSQGGLGIGLSLSKGLVEMHDGEIRAYSKGLGKGSEFVVRLPVASALPAPAEPAADRSAPAAKKYRIVVADDLRDSADSLQLLLQAMGHEVQVAYDGEQALGAVEAFAPDLAFIDLGMPNVNGYQACRRIREQPWGQRVVLIALTGWGEENDRRRTREAGFDHHVVKPLDPTTLEALIDTLEQQPSGVFSG